MATHYDTLRISRDATTEQIRQAWRQRCLETHPDKVGNIPANNTTFSAVQHAYEVLSNPSERAWYDSTLPRPHHSPFGSGPSSNSSSSSTGPSTPPTTGTGTSPPSYAQFCTIHAPSRPHTRIPHNTSFVSGGRKYCLCLACRTSYTTGFFADLEKVSWLAATLLSLLENRLVLETKYPAMFPLAMWLHASRVWDYADGLERFLRGVFVAGLEEVIYCPGCNFPVHERLVEADWRTWRVRKWMESVGRVQEVMGVLVEGGLGKKEGADWCWKLVRALEELQV